MHGILFLSMTQNSLVTRVIVVGGGFAGIETARRIAFRVGSSVKVTLISNKSYFEYYPGLYRVVTGSSPIEVAIPLEEMVPSNVEILIDTVTSVDVVGKKVVCQDTGEYIADYLVLAMGSETTYFDVPGLDTMSFGFKSIKEANRLKEHITTLFKTHTHPSQNELVSHFHIVVVGGGPSGVEVAGDLAIFMKKIAKLTEVDPSFITVDLIESNPRVVPQLPPDVSERILAQLRKLGVNIFLNRRLEREEVEQVFMKDMSLKAKTVIWTAGTRLNQIYSHINGLEFANNKRVVVDDYLQAHGHTDVYIVGDAANTKYSGLAQTAMYDGAFVAKQILGQIRGIKNRALYSPKKVALSIPVGNDWGVFVYGPIKIYGGLGYFIRHAIDFVYFAGIVAPLKFFSLFVEGWKYRVRK
ncbi:MAG: Pyr redox 2 protein [Patescibacteria group bacterium]|nr:Pyr redox 2 protein [Patescibacteria group bacterium]